MALRRNKGKGPGQSKAAGPVLTLPENTDRKTRRTINKLLQAELGKIEAEREKRVPHLYRWRFQLVPLAWLAGACAGLVSHAAQAGVPLERGWSDAALLERCPVGLQRARQAVEGRQGLLVGRLFCAMSINIHDFRRQAGSTQGPDARFSLAPAPAPTGR